MADVLVVFYPRSQATLRAARWIANDLDADIDVIPDPPETGPLSWLKRTAAAVKSMRRSVVAARPRPRNVNDYAVVVVGTPVWDASLATAVRRYLRNETLLAPKLAFFCTSRDDGGHRALERMAECARRRPVARLALGYADIVAADRKAPELERFVQAVRSRVVRQNVAVAG